MHWLANPVFPRPRAPFWLLVAITASGTLAMHVLVPSLPLAARDLGVSAAAIQQAITLYLFGVAFGQLLYGPVSDRLGRRPVLMAALAVYVAATVVAGLATSLGVLLAARIVQAVGGCGGLVLGRAVVRDGAAPDQAASQMALLTMTQSLAPGIGPAIGGYLGVWFGWRSIFAVLAALGAFTLAATILILPETARSRGAAPQRMLTSYARLLRAPDFRGFMLGGAFTSTSMYAYLAALPFIITQSLHRPAEEVGLYYLAILVGIPIGSFAASRLARRARLSRLLRVTNGHAVFAAAVLFAVTVTGHLSVAGILAPMLLYTIGVGATSPIALASAIGTQPHSVGAASGLYGFTQMAFGALCTFAVGLWAGEQAVTAAAILLVSTLAGQLAFMRATRPGRPVVL